MADRSKINIKSPSSNEKLVYAHATKRSSKRTNRKANHQSKQFTNLLEKEVISAQEKFPDHEQSHEPARSMLCFDPAGLVMGCFGQPLQWYLKHGRYRDWDDCSIPSEVYLAEPSLINSSEKSISKLIVTPTLDTTYATHLSSYTSKDDTHAFSLRERVLRDECSYSGAHAQNDDSDLYLLQRSVSSISNPSYDCISFESFPKKFHEEDEAIGDAKDEQSKTLILANDTATIGPTDLHSKDSLLSFDASVPSAGKSDFVDLLSFDSVGDEEGADFTKLAEFCDNSVQSSVQQVKSSD